MTNLQDAPAGDHLQLQQYFVCSQRVVVAAVLVLVVIATAGCGTRDAATPQSSAESSSVVAPADSGFVAGGPAVQLYSGSGRTSPKPVAGELLDGGSFDLAALRGKVVVVNWWGSWCEPCRRETPHLVQAYDATRGPGVEFVGVDVRDSRPAALSFVADYQVPYRSLFDPADRIVLGFPQVPPAVVPTTVVLDRSGRVAVAFRKVIDKGELESAIRHVAAEPPPVAGG